MSGFSRDTMPGGGGKKDEIPRPLQTPTAGPATTPTTTTGTGSQLKLDDVPVSGKTSPRLTTPVTGSRPSSTSTADTEKTKEIMSKVDKATKTMEQNIQAATQRGESLNELQDRTQVVAESSKQFSKNARTVKKNLWWKNMKFTLIITFIIIIVLTVIAVALYLEFTK